MSCDITTLQSELGIGYKKVRGYMVQGMPYDKDGRKYKFDPTECREWIKENIQGGNEVNLELLKVQKIKADIAKTKAETRKLNLDHKIKKGELVPIDEIVAVIDRQFTAVRARILSLPKKTAPILESARDIEEIQEILEDQVREVLQELTGWTKV